MARSALGTPNQPRDHWGGAEERKPAMAAAKFDVKMFLVVTAVAFAAGFALRFLWQGLHSFSLSAIQLPEFQSTRASFKSSSLRMK